MLSLLRWPAAFCFARTAYAKCGAKSVEPPWPLGTHSDSQQLCLCSTHARESDNPRFRRDRQLLSRRRQLQAQEKRAERQGFEPWVPCGHTGFRDHCSEFETTNSNNSLRQPADAAVPLVVPLIIRTTRTQRSHRHSIWSTPIANACHRWTPICRARASAITQPFFNGPEPHSTRLISSFLPIFLKSRKILKKAARRSPHLGLVVLERFGEILF
jgi:hypothetical protein